MIPIEWRSGSIVLVAKFKHYTARQNNDMTQATKKPRFKFFRDIFAELKKVTWPTRRQAAYLTAVVIATCIVVGIILGTIDYGFSKLVQILIG